jgi:hypothetical protein
VRGIVLTTELQLPLSDVIEIHASLHKRLDLREDRAGVEVPGPSTLLHDLLLRLLEDLLPHLPALLTLLQVLHTLQNVPIEHVRLVDDVDTAVDDLVRDLAEEASDALCGVVELALLPDLAHLCEDVWEDLGDLVWLGDLELLAWLLKDAEVLQVVLGLVLPHFNLRAQLVEDV